jgi:hypothetical protein
MVHRGMSVYAASTPPLLVRYQERRTGCTYERGRGETLPRISRPLKVMVAKQKVIAFRGSGPNLAPHVLLARHLEEAHFVALHTRYRIAHSLRRVFAHSVGRFLTGPKSFFALPEGIPSVLPVWRSARATIPSNPSCCWSCGRAFYRT